MAFKSRDLLDQLADLQLALEGYSLQQLSVEEASALKRSFEQFRSQFEDKLWRTPTETRAGAGKPATPEMREADSLITAVSHDIRIPLNSIQGYSDLLLEESLDPTQRRHVEAIRSASQTLCGILDELLLFSRLKSGEEGAVAVPFDPRSVLLEASDFAKMLLKGKPVEFRCDIPEELPETLTGDPSKLKRILLNLLENAAKYVSGGHVSLSARAVSRGGHCTLWLEVSDSGIGIPKGELPHIFKPYYQAKQRGETAGQGHGLGLSIVKKLIEQQGGSIEVASEEGSGSAFQLQLPYTYKRKGVDGKSAVKEDQQPYGRELQGVRVLFFEDNPMNAALMRARLERWGCMVFHAQRVPLGIQLLEREAIDLVLMDLRMPQMDGFQAARRIRSHGQQRIQGIPILAVTADFSAVDKEHLGKSGIDGVLLKPYDPRELHVEMVRLCRERPPAGALPKGEDRPEAATAAGETLLTLDYLEAECMGNIEMLRDMVRMLRGNLLEFVGRMKVHLQEEDYAAITEASHKMISGLKMVQANKHLALAQEIHYLASLEGTMQRIASAYGEFMEGYPELENSLDRELDKRTNKGR